MAWLRIDDGFTANSKIAQLTDADFRVWMRLLCHCAHSRDPSVDSVAKREVSGLTTARIRRFETLELLDEIGDGFEIHGWASFMPKEEQNAARQAKWRARRRNAESNDGRNAEVTRPVDEKVTVEPSRARAGTRGVPSRPQEQEPLLHPSSRDAARSNGRTDGDLERITAEDAHAAGLRTEHT